MKNLRTLDREGFLDVLSHLPYTIWTASIEDRCIHLRRLGSSIIYSPMTAVYFELTGEELHRGSFWHPEITRRFGLSEYEILEITYAEICCECNGKEYQKSLRQALENAIRRLFPKPS